MDIRKIFCHIVDRMPEDELDEMLPLLTELKENRLQETGLYKLCSMMINYITSEELEQICHTEIKEKRPA